MSPVYSPSTGFLRLTDQCFLARRFAASPSGPVARNGFSLAHNSDRLTAISIPGSKLPACYFAPLPGSVSVPVRPFGSTALIRFAAGHGRFTAAGPLHFCRPVQLAALSVSAPLQDFYVPRDRCVLQNSLPTGPPDEFARFPLAPRCSSYFYSEHRIIVPGPLRFRRLAVPQTSWNLLHYDLEAAFGQPNFVNLDPFSSIFI